MGVANASEGIRAGHPKIQKCRVDKKPVGAPAAHPFRTSGSRATEIRKIRDFGAAASIVAPFSLTPRLPVPKIATQSFSPSHDRSNHLALPHCRKAGRRRDGCGL